MSHFCVSKSSNLVNAPPKCCTFVSSEAGKRAAQFSTLNSQFSILKTMIRYILKQNKNMESRAYQKWYAFPVIEETLNLDDLAEHMSNHNSPYSKGVIKGLLTDMVNCIRELLLEGKNVKIDDLAIFSIGIKNAKGGAESEEDFSVSKNISSVKLRARATGILLSKALNLEASLKKATAITGKAAADTSGDGEGGGD